MKIFLLILCNLVVISSAKAQSRDGKAPIAPKAATSKATEAAKLNALAPSLKSSILSAPIRKPATLDPNSAVEVRGQARTLSMMLVLKNGKDSINFIKVRKDYHAEIQATNY
jgi:hypothetical protein